jgi:hypothetical protein
MPAGGTRRTKPRTLPQLAQITQVRYTAGDETADGVLTIVDDDSGQSYTVTGTGSATEATFLDNMVAAVQGDGKVNDLFTVTEDGVDDLVLTARHRNRSYTITASGGPAVTTPAVSNLQTAGGGDLGFGLACAKGPSDGEIQALSATSVKADIAGVLFRTEGNHFHDLDDDSGADELDRGRTHAVLEQGRLWVAAEDAVSPTSKVYVRRAQTSSAGTVGAFRAGPDGSAQVSTVAPPADQTFYGLGLQLRDADGHVRSFNVTYEPTDGTTAVADAIDGLFDAISDAIGGATAAANGLGVTVTESDTLLTFTTDAGVEIVDLTSSAWISDTEAAQSTVVIGTADVDTIDVSDLFEWETTTSAAGLAKLKVKMA